MYSILPEACSFARLFASSYLSYSNLRSPCENKIASGPRLLSDSMEILRLFDPNKSDFTQVLVMLPRSNPSEPEGPLGDLEHWFLGEEQEDGDPSVKF